MSTATTMIGHNNDESSNQTTKKNKVIAHEVVSLRAARGNLTEREQKEDCAPLIVTIPKNIIKSIGVRKRDKLHIYSDGFRIYMDRLEPRNEV